MALDNEEDSRKSKDELSQARSRISGELAKLSNVMPNPASESTKQQLERRKQSFQALQSEMALKQTRLEELHKFSMQLSTPNSTVVTAGLTCVAGVNDLTEDFVVIPFKTTETATISGHSVS